MLVNSKGVIAILLALTFQILNVIAQLDNIVFRVARFSGNESAGVLAYSAGTTVVLETLTVFTCGALCMIGEHNNITAIFLQGCS